MFARITSKLISQESLTLVEIMAMGIALVIGVTLAWTMCPLWFGAAVHMADWVSQAVR